MRKHRTLCILPARGGSKGLHRKNIRPLGDRPLIAWTIEAARNAKHVDRVIVSTDDEEIAIVARECGAEVPFFRPAELATDVASSEVVLQHALDWAESDEGAPYDIVVYLQITDPFRQRGIVDQVVSTLVDDDRLDTVFAARPEHKNYWSQDGDTYRPLGRHNHLARQQKQPMFREDTGIALASRAAVIRSGRRIGDHVKLVPHENPADFIDIHNEFDLWLANQILASGKVIPNG